MKFLSQKRKTMDARNSLIESAVNLQVESVRLTRKLRGIPKRDKCCRRAVEDVEELQGSLDELIGCIMDVYFRMYCAEES